MYRFIFGPPGTSTQAEINHNKEQNKVEESISQYVNRDISECALRMRALPSLWWELGRRLVLLFLQKIEKQLI